MKTNVRNVEIVKKISFDELPDGEYKGTWGGYIAEFTHDETTYRFRTNDGIRTPSAPCTIVVESGNVEVFTI